MKRKLPLVSVVIITYNSSEFIMECLDSIAVQTYDNIELIISDDCSTDNTIALCKTWLSKYQGRFVNTELLEITENTGITKNINRGCKLAKGEWIKPLAGDDLLLPICIEKNIGHCEGKKILFSQAEMFSMYTGEKTIIPGKDRLAFFNFDAYNQFKELFITNNFFMETDY